LGLLSLAASTQAMTLAHPSTSTHVPILSSPQTPTWQKNHDDALSSPQLIPSLSHLTCYLEYAQVPLGVHHVLTHKISLQLNGIGPDILPDVNDKFLSDLGISTGDVICLKKDSMAWWNGPDAK